MIPQKRHYRTRSKVTSKEVFPDTNMNMSSLRSAVQLQKSKHANFSGSPSETQTTRFYTFCELQSRTVSTRIRKNKYDNRRVLRFSAKVLCRTLRRSWKRDHAGTFQGPSQEVQKYRNQGEISSNGTLKIKRM